MKKPSLSDLTLREKIGQTALGRCDNPGINDTKTYPYGALWANGDLQFGVNIDELDPNSTKREKWLQGLKQMNKNLKVPLIQAGDCGVTIAAKEYGRVLDATTVGATASEELAYETGTLRGRMLRHAGTNWLWSPICDFSGRFVTGSVGRIYTDDPEKLLSMNLATMKGLHDVGVCATAKHFPGGGIMGDNDPDFTDWDAGYRDSHISESINLCTKEEWDASSRKQFQGMIDAGVEAIMTSHQSFPAVDNTMRRGRYVPSTLSYKVITELLKEEMGFKGVVITDDVWMRSVSTYCDDNLERVYIESIKAGCDMVLGVKDFYFDVIEDAVNRGEISQERIDDACQRVLDLKEKAGLFDDDYELTYGDLDQINADMAAFCEKAAKKAISLVSDDNKLLPLNPEKHKKICIIYSGHDEEGKGRALDQMPVMTREFEKRGAEVFFRRGLKNGFDSEAELAEIAEKYDLIVYVGYSARWMPRGYGAFFGDEVITFQNALRSGTEKSIGIGIGNPTMYYDFYEAFLTYVNVPNYFPELIRATVAALYGEIDFEGITPFQLLPRYVEKRYKMLEELEKQQ